MITSEHSRKLGAMVFLTIASALFFRFFLTVFGLQLAFWFPVTLGIGFLGLRSIRGELERVSPNHRTIVSWGLLGLLGILGLPFCSRDYFLWDFNQISRGMTQSQVESTMHQYIPEGGVPRWSARGTGNCCAKNLKNASGPDRTCQTYKHSNDGLWNADVGRVCYEDRRVVSTNFSPD